MASWQPEQVRVGGRRVGVGEGDRLVHRALLYGVAAVAVGADGRAGAAFGHQARVDTALVGGVFRRVALAAGLVVLQGILAAAGDRLPGRMLSLGHVAMTARATDYPVHRLAEILGGDLEKHGFPILELFLQLLAVALEALRIGVARCRRSRSRNRQSRQHGDGEEQTSQRGHGLHGLYRFSPIQGRAAAYLAARFFW